MTSTTSLYQRHRALEIANHVRHQRALLKLELQALSFRDGCQRLGSLLDDEVPDWLVTVPVGKMLAWPQRMGPRTVMQTTARLQASPGKPVGGLTDRQRGVLVDWLYSGRRTAGGPV